MEASNLRKWGIASAPLRRVAWLLPFAFALHELEEWNIAAWYQRYWTNVDAALVTQRNAWTWLVFASLVGFAWTALAARFRSARVMFHVLLVFFVAVFSHCFAHVYWQISLGAYAPGVVTAVLLVIPITFYVTVRAIRERLVSAFFPIALLVLTILPVLMVLRLGNRLPEGGMPMLRFSSWLADLFGIPTG